MRHKIICSECGMDFPYEELKNHVLKEHSIKKECEDQAQIELAEIDRMKEYKAQQYDRIADMFFMSCGVIEDGDSLKYIIDPETVAEELMKIVVEDIDIDREQFISRKTDHFNGKRIKSW